MSQGSQMDIGRRARGVVPPATLAREVDRSVRAIGARATARLLEIDPKAVEAIRRRKRVLRATLFLAESNAKLLASACAGVRGRLGTGP